jgi:hypothetical protein
VGWPFLVVSVIEAEEVVKGITGNGWNSQYYVCGELWSNRRIMCIMDSGNNGEESLGTMKHI